MDKQDFPEIDQLELERVKRELAEAKSRIEKYEQILQEHDLLEVVPSVSDSEIICINQIEKYRKACQDGAVLTLEEVKIVEIMIRSLILVRGKSIPEDKKKGKKEEKIDVAKLLQIAGGKSND